MSSSVGEEALLTSRCYYQEIFMTWRSRIAEFLKALAKTYLKVYHAMV